MDVDKKPVRLVDTSERLFRLPNPACLLKVIVNFIGGLLSVGAPIGGHTMTQESHMNNCTVLVLKCMRCGKYEVLWETTARSTEVRETA